MKTRNKFFKPVTVGSIGAILLVVLFSHIGSTDNALQPILFNHKKHVQRHVLCKDCHFLYERHSKAGIPGVQRCVRCHEEVIHKTEEKDKIQKYRASGKEIPWTRIYLIKPDIYGLDRPFAGIPNKVLGHVYGGKDRFNFSHRLHTIIGKVECLNCHGDVGNMDKPITKSAVKINMDYCVSCHKSQGKEVSTDCAACHR
jgi:Cytochrome c7 and related cytochrome c